MGNPTYLHRRDGSVAKESAVIDRKSRSDSPDTTSTLIRLIRFTEATVDLGVPSHIVDECRDNTGRPRWTWSSFCVRTSSKWRFYCITSSVHPTSPSCVTIKKEIPLVCPHLRSVERVDPNQGHFDVPLLRSTGSTTLDDSRRLTGKGEVVFKEDVGSTKTESLSHYLRSTKEDKR